MNKVNGLMRFKLEISINLPVLYNANVTKHRVFLEGGKEDVEIDNRNVNGISVSQFQIKIRQ